MKPMAIDLDFLRTNYETLGPRGCAKALNVSLSHVQRNASAHGIRMPKSGRNRLHRNAMLKPHDQYAVNPSQFMNVNTPEAAYVLGMIWADGHVSYEGCTPCISMCQVNSDMNLIRLVLDRTGRWRYSSVKKRKDSHQQATVAATSNRPLADYLTQHGYRSKSTQSACSILSTIPDHLKHYWFRGLFDGDGCLFEAKQDRPNNHCGAQISSHLKQDWTHLEKLSEALRIDYRIHRTIRNRTTAKGDTQGESTFILGAMRDARVFLDYIYQGRSTDRIGLDRKWTKWLDIKSIRFSRGNNRYLGVSRNGHGWRTVIPAKRYGLPKRIYVGMFSGEEEAYLAQQDMIKHLGLSLNRVHEYGP